MAEKGKKKNKGTAAPPAAEQVAREERLAAALEISQTDLTEALERAKAAERAALTARDQRDRAEQARQAARDAALAAEAERDQAERALAAQPAPDDWWADEWRPPASIEESGPGPADLGQVEPIVVSPPPAPVVEETEEAEEAPVATPVAPPTAPAPARERKSWLPWLVVGLAVILLGCCLASAAAYVFGGDLIAAPTPTGKVERPVEVKEPTVCLDVDVEGTAVTFAVYQGGEEIDWHAVSFRLATGQEVTVLRKDGAAVYVPDPGKGFRVYRAYGSSAEPIGLCPWTRLTAAPQPTAQQPGQPAAPPVAPSAPEGACKDNESLQNESHPDQTRIPLFQSGYRVYVALGWVPGNGFAGHGRIHIIVPDSSTHQATFDVGSEGDVSRTGYCGTRQEIAANAVAGQVEFHRQASQRASDGQRPSVQEIPVFFLNLDGRLETVKDAPLGPAMADILARLSLSQEGVGTIQIIPDGRYTGGQAAGAPAPAQNPPPEEKGAGVCATGTEAASATGTGAFTAPTAGIAVFSYGEGDAQQKRVTALRVGETFDAKGVVGFAFWSVSPGCADLDAWAKTDPVAPDGRTFVAFGELQAWINGLAQ